MKTIRLKMQIHQKGKFLLMLKGYSSQTQSSKEVFSDVQLCIYPEAVGAVV